MVNMVPSISIHSLGTPALDSIGVLIPITGTSRSSRKMEWYACIEGYKGLQGHMKGIKTYRHSQCVK